MKRWDERGYPYNKVSKIFSQYEHNLMNKIHVTILNVNKRNSKFSISFGTMRKGEMNLGH